LVTVIVLSNVRTSKAATPGAHRTEALRRRRPCGAETAAQPPIKRPIRTLNITIIPCCKTQD
jgi:hypothetical protein